MQVDRKALIRALKTATPVMERRNTIPILGAARLQAERALTIEVTDLDIEMRVTLPYEGSTLDYCQLSPGSLIPLLKASDADTIDLTRDKDAGGYHLNAGALTVKLGAGLPSTDFPVMAGGTEVWTAAIGTKFMDKLKRVALAMSSEETRYYLNGVYFHHVADWTYRLVATDGHRLIYANVELPDAPDGKALAHMGSPGGVIIPRKMVATLMRIHAERRDAPIRFGLVSTAAANDKPGSPADLASQPKTRVRFEAGDVWMQGKLIDGTFPDYSRVIPKEGKHVAELKTADLRRVVGALVGFIPERARAMKLRFERDRLIVSASHIELGANAELSIPCETKGGEFEVGFNGRYLLTAITAAGGEVTHFSSDDASAPTLFYDPTSTDVRTVLMPMRV